MASLIGEISRKIKTEYLNRCTSKGVDRLLLEEPKIMSAGWLASIRAKGASGGRGEVLANQGKETYSSHSSGIQFSIRFSD